MTKAGYDPRQALNLFELLRQEIENEGNQEPFFFGTHPSVQGLDRDIRGWIQAWNDDPHPYVWVKTADQILASLGRYCERISDSAH